MPQWLFNSDTVRSLNSNYTISAVRHATVSYSINASWALQSLLSGSGAAYLEFSMDGGGNWTTVNQVSKSLALLTFAGSDDMNLCGEIPAGALVRLRTTTTNMTITYVRGQETLI